MTEHENQGPGGGPKPPKPGGKPASGWSDVLGHVTLDGSAADQVGLVDRSKMADDDQFAYHPDPRELSRKQDHAGPAPEGGPSLPPADTRQDASRPESGFRLPLPGEGDTPGPGPVAPVGSFGKAESFSALFEPDGGQSGKGKKPIVIGGVVLLALLVVGGFLTREGGQGGATDATGNLMINSKPEGATIYVDGVSTGHQTPFELSQMALDTLLSVSVRLKNYKSFPEQAKLTIPYEAQHASLFFSLKPTQTFRVVTTPAGADVLVDGNILPGVTPKDLPPVVAGDQVEVTVRLTGYLDEKFVLEASPETPLVRELKLKQANVINIISEPPGAKVFIGEEQRGVTPQYDVPVPKGRFRVRIALPGFKTWKKRLRGKRIGEEGIRVTLTPAPLLAMDLKPEERREAKKLDRRLTRLRHQLESAQRKLAKVERIHERVTSDPNSMFGQRAKVERAVDVSSQRVEQLEAAYGEVEVQLEVLRNQVIARLEQSE